MIKQKGIKIIVTGGAGFIGSNFIRMILKDRADWAVLNYDKLTYAGNTANLTGLESKYPGRYTFVQGDICDSASFKQTLDSFRPDYIVNFAAETHVDRSIDGPLKFIQTNTFGSAVLANESLSYYRNLSAAGKQKFRILHVSTDEVFGTLGLEGKFSEQTSYDPSSPYSASKASSDHIFRAWHRTFGLPVLITNCSNNYGPYQFPEKLIPLMIINAVLGKKLPVYGKGENIRDWIYVEDHCQGIWRVLTGGIIGETYNIGGDCEKTNIKIVHTICDILDTLSPSKTGNSYREQIEFVKDRPGHDFRYAIDSSKIQTNLNWQPEETFETGIRKTIVWYLNNRDWWQEIQNNNYNQTRLGLTKGQG